MVFIKQRARTAFAKTSGSAVPPAGRAYRSLIWARGVRPPGRKPFDEHRALQSRHRTRPDLLRLQVPFLNAGTRKLPHNGTDPEARPTAFWRKVRDSGAGKWK